MVAELIRIDAGGAANPVADVVFVHGLGGDPKATWGAGDPEGGWGRWLGEDLPQVAVHAVRYEAEPMAWKGEGLGVLDRALNLLSLLDANDLGTRPLVFVTHSLGGLVVKQMLLAADSYGHAAWSAMLGQVRGVAFIATPHDGAKIATVVRRLALLLRPTAVMGDLESNAAALRGLNYWFRNNAGRLGVRVEAYAETRDVRRLAIIKVRVVDPASSDPGMTGVTPIPIDADHINITTPASRGAEIYLAVAKFVKSCLAASGAAMAAGPAPPAQTPPVVPVATAVTSHRRQFAPRAMVIDDPDLLAALDNPTLNDAPEFQVRMAVELATFLGFRYGEWRGPANAVWREGEQLMLSLLPDFQHGHQTLEFGRSAKGWELAGVWEPLDAALGPMEVEAWQPAVAGLFADRTPISMEREATLLILGRQGAPLGYPVAPRGGEAVRLCAWVGPEQAPGDDYFEWGRDPRLVAGHAAMVRTIYHRPRDIGFLNFALQGRWSPLAFSTLNEAMRVLLPGRRLMRVVEYGSVRVGVYLGSTSTGEAPTPVIFRRYLAARLRMQAALRDIAVEPPLASSAVPAPSESETRRFAEVFDLVGDRECPPLVDGADAGFWAADWVKLRQVYSGIFPEPEPPNVDHSPAATASGLRQLLAELEGRA